MEKGNLYGIGEISYGISSSSKQMTQKELGDQVKRICDVMGWEGKEWSAAGKNWTEYSLMLKRLGQRKGKEQVAFKSQNQLTPLIVKKKKKRRKLHDSDPRKFR